MWDSAVDRDQAVPGITKESSKQFLEGARVKKILKKMEHLDWLWDPCIILCSELQTFSRGVKQRN